MGDVLEMKLQTTVDVPVEKVLDAAKGCDEVIVIGTVDGEPYYATSTADSYRVLWMVEKFKAMLLDDN